MSTMMSTRNLASLALILFLGFTIDAATLKGEKVKIDLYYEFLCPACQQFVHDQLHPTVQEIGDIMDVTLIPYGNADTTKNPDGSYSFNCQHGPDECLGNKLHTCAIAKLDVTQEVLISFVKCTEAAQGTIVQRGETCAKKLEVPFEEVKRCFTSNEGDKLLAEMGDKTEEETKKHGRNYVPWIVVNGVHDEPTQEKCQENLKQVVCEKYTGPRPEKCDK